MFNFIQKGLEYNKLAKAFNGNYIMLHTAIQSSNSGVNIIPDIYILAYLGRKEILDRIDKYKWNMNSPIAIPMISSSRITLLMAYQATIGEVMRIASEKGILDKTSEILEGGPAYFEMDRTVPASYKNMF